MKRKVYARFYHDSNTDLTYRTIAILQFGDSWDIIGAAVLANPGTADLNNEVISQEEMSHLSGITNYIDNWSVVNFNRDTTIRDWIPRIFNGYFNNNRRELNGVIILFNIFNVKDQNQLRAVENHSTANSRYLYMSDSDITLINSCCPIVYLGWGDAVMADPKLKSIANKIFNRIEPRLISAYDRDFNCNKFYHPRAVQLGFRRWNSVKKVISDFDKAIISKPQK